MASEAPPYLWHLHKRLQKVRKRAQALVEELVPEKKSPVHEALFVLLRRAATAADSVNCLYEAGLVQDAAAVARTVLECMLYGVYIVCDPEPKLRALQYLDLGLWAALEKRHRLIEELGLPVPPSPLPGKTIRELILANMAKATEKLPEGYRSKRWPPGGTKNIFDQLKLKPIHHRHYRILCQYVHPDPSMWLHFSSTNRQLDSADEKELSGSGALQAGIGSLEILCGMGEILKDRKGTKAIRRKRKDILGLVKRTFVPAAGMFLDPKP